MALTLNHLCETPSQVFSIGAPTEWSHSRMSMCPCAAAPAPTEGESTLEGWRTEAVLEGDTGQVYWCPNACLCAP